MWVVGILNVTPDSFSDGGQYTDQESIQKRVAQMVSEGADWIDVGGESSGPGSQDVSLQQELDRVLPAIEIIRAETDLPISVDTYKAEVAAACLDHGVQMINDVTAFRGDPNMASLLAQRGCPAVIMFSKDPNARTTTADQDYDDVMATIIDFFRERVAFFQRQGGDPQQLILDPGMGFFVSGKAQYSFEILNRLPELKALGHPLFLGTSRKSFLTNLCTMDDQPLHGRDIPSMTTGTIALMQGASYLRVHHVPYGRVACDTVRQIKGIS